MGGYFVISVNKWIMLPLLLWKHRNLRTNLWQRSLINYRKLVNNAFVCCSWLPWWQHQQHLCSDCDELWIIRCWIHQNSSLLLMIRWWKCCFYPLFNPLREGSRPLELDLNPSAAPLCPGSHAWSTCGCVFFSCEQSISRTVDRRVHAGGGEPRFVSRSSEAVPRIRHGWAHHQARHVGNCHGVAWRHTESRERASECVYVCVSELQPLLLAWWLNGVLSFKGIKCVYNSIKLNNKTLKHLLAPNPELWIMHAPDPHPPAPSARVELFLLPGSSARTQSTRWWRPWRGRRDTARRGGTGWVHRQGTRTWRTEGWRPPWGRRRRAGVPQTSRTAAQPGSKRRDQSALQTEPLSFLS